MSLPKNEELSRPGRTEHDIVCDSCGHIIGNSVDNKHALWDNKIFCPYCKKIVPVAK